MFVFCSAVPFAKKTAKRLTFLMLRNCYELVYCKLVSARVLNWLLGGYRIYRHYTSTNTEVDAVIIVIEIFRLYIFILLLSGGSSEVVWLQSKLFPLVDLISCSVNSYHALSSWMFICLATHCPFEGYVSKVCITWNSCYWWYYGKFINKMKVISVMSLCRVVLELTWNTIKTQCNYVFSWWVVVIWPNNNWRKTLTWLYGTGN